MYLFKNNEIFFTLPIILFIIFLFISNTKRYKNINKLIVKRIYYMLCLLWSFKFIITFYSKIISVSINGSNSIVSKTSRNYINILWCIIILFILSVVWDFLFISCRVITDFSFKGFNVKTEQYNEIEKISISKTEDLDIMNKILQTEYKIISEMEEYVTNIDDFQGFKDYENLIKKYIRIRNGIKIKCYLYEESNIENFKEKHRLSSLEYSTIRYCLDKYYVYSNEKNEASDKDEVFCIIKTKFANYNILMDIVGDRVMPNEYLVIQHIVSYYDRLVDIVILKLKNDEVELN